MSASANALGFWRARLPRPRIRIVELEVPGAKPANREQWIVFSAVFWFLPTVFMLVLPALQNIKLTDGEYFAQPTRAGDLVSVSHFISATPAAGVFASLFTVPVVFALFLPQTAGTRLRRGAIMTMYTCILFVVATPEALLPGFHSAAALLCVLALNLVAWAVLTGNPNVFPIRVAALLTVVFTIILLVIRFIHEFTNAVGYAFFFIEVMLFTTGLAFVPLSLIGSIES